MTAQSAEAYDRELWRASQGYERNIIPRNGACDVVFTNHPIIDQQTFAPVSSREQTASWYGNGLHGNLLRSESPFDECDGTVVASNTYPPGTVLRVSYAGRSILVVVQDSGGEPVNYRIDLSRGAMQLLEPNHEVEGTIQVVVEIMQPVRLMATSE